MSKPRFATTWLGGCSGCHMSFLDLDEHLIELAELVDICYTPIADFKTFPANVDLTLVEGAVANEEHVHDLRLIRQRTRTLVAFGDCAINGNVTAMRNLFSVDDLLQRAYQESEIVSGIPSGNGIVPKLLERVCRVQDIVDVDHFLPGCPPSAGSIYNFVLALVEGKAPMMAGRKFGS